jgi:hypothetical protein
LAGQRHDSYDGGNHHRSGDEQHDTAALGFAVEPRLLPHRFRLWLIVFLLLRAHLVSGSPALHPFPHACTCLSLYYTIP